MKLSAKERAVLEVLVREQGEMYGIQIAMSAGETSGMAAVYIALTSLQNKGLVSSRVGSQVGFELPRKIYRATERGIAVAERADSE